MTANSELKITIKQWLMRSEIDRLDAELILAYALRKNREWLLAHSDEKIPADTAKDLLERRQNHEPLAYILGHKEFYGHNFIVTPDVLIPRPETEQIIDCIDNLRETRKVLDVGCGSGCVGITLKLEHPEIDITLSDISQKALKIARKNAVALNAEVKFIMSDLMTTIRSDMIFDVIVANLPYVDRTWRISPELKYEPETALFADDNGLALIKKLINQAPKHLSQNGYLIIEFDPRQKTAVKNYARKYNFKIIQELPFVAVFQLSLMPF